MDTTSRRQFGLQSANTRNGTLSASQSSFRRGDKVIVGGGAKATFDRPSKTPGKAIVISNSEEVEVKLSSLTRATD